MFINFKLTKNKKLRCEFSQLFIFTDINTCDVYVFRYSLFPFTLKGSIKISLLINIEL